LHATEKTINEDGNITVKFTAVSTNGHVINGGITLTAQEDTINVGKDYDMNLQEIVPN